MEKKYNAIPSVPPNIPRWVPLKYHTELCKINKQMEGQQLILTYMCRRNIIWLSCFRLLLLECHLEKQSFSFLRNARNVFWKAMRSLKFH